MSQRPEDIEEEFRRDFAWRRSHGLGNRTVNLTGQRFGDLTVVTPTGEIQNKKLLWWCVCICGNLKIVRSSHLIAGAIDSCGHAVDRHKPKNVKHGLSRDPRYRIYGAMLRRCYSKDCENYKNYGGRGIRVDSSWLGLAGFLRFVRDMGPRPIGKSLDRIDNDGDYTKANCRWASQNEQMYNRRVTLRFEYDGKQKTIAQLSAIAGVPKKAMWRRLVERKWSVDRAVNQKPRKSPRRRGESVSS